MPSLPKLSTLVSWLVYLIPLYIFIGVPILSQLFPGSSPETVFDYAADIETSGLNLTDSSALSPADDVPADCPGAEYKVHILSHEPLVIYIENFLSDDEADHLVDIRYVFLRS